MARADLTKTWTDADLAQAVALLEEGLTLRTLSERVGRSREFLRTRILDAKGPEWWAEHVGRNKSVGRAPTRGSWAGGHSVNHMRKMADKLADGPVRFSRLLDWPLNRRVDLVAKMRARGLVETYDDDAGHPCVRLTEAGRALLPRAA